MRSWRVEEAIAEYRREARREDWVVETLLGYIEDLEWQNRRLLVELRQRGD